MSAKSPLTTLRLFTLVLGQNQAPDFFIQIKWTDWVILSFRSARKWQMASESQEQNKNQSQLQRELAASENYLCLRDLNSFMTKEVSIFLKKKAF